MFDKRLIRIINNGRCFVFVGAGPSCEIGYPSWKKLAEQTYEKLKQIGNISDFRSYEKYLTDKKYPELFRQAERDLGERILLVNLVKSLLKPTRKQHGILYDLICKWPFACYLTTNYDDEIASYLSNIGEHFTVIRNRQEDFYHYRDGVSHMIQKLHSDLNYPNEVILTSSDYRRFCVEASGQYFRDKLRQIFETYDLLILGHSLADPDIEFALQLAKNTSSPQHPIYLIAADFTETDEREFFEKYNIVLVQYSNRDGTHSDLKRLLKNADRFIVSRQRLRERTETTVRPKGEAESAIALFLYRRLQGIDATEYLCPLILAGFLSTEDDGIPKEEIISMPSLKILNNGQANFQEATTKAVEQLLQQNFVVETNGNIKITANGQTKVQECQSIRITEKDQAYGQFRLSLKKNYEGLTDAQSEQCINLAEEVLIASFSNRSMAISNQIYSDQSASPEELSDVFGAVSDSAATIDDLELRVAFVEAMHQFIIEPNPPQRKYLASVSQGYFLYHLLGLDPNYCQIRQEIFQRTFWICDSSIILPRVAIGCHNHAYAVELFKMLSSAKALIFTTSKLLQEIWKHFDWALQFIKNTGVESPEFLRAALVKGSYKQNLFIDGYIRLCADGRIGTFKDYLDIILKNGEISRNSFDENISNAGIHLLNITDLDGFTQEDWGEIEEAKSNIQNERERRGIYRSSLQVESEGEIWTIVKHFRDGKYAIKDIDRPEKIYFVSQSRIIDQVFQQQAVTTWTPEAVYRYLSALSENEINSDLLQQCMLNEYYYAGISFIDSDRYNRFFGPSINAAKISFEKEKTKYITELEKAYTKDIDDAFAKTPDLEKPFFVTQMGWKLAEESRKREELAKKRALDAEIKAKKLESEKDKAWKIRGKRSQEQETARLRNLRDTKHLRKRQKQAKKRKKKR